MRNTRTNAALVLAASLALSACEEASETSYQGYVEGEYIHIAPLQPGHVVSIDVRRGDQAKEGTRLVQMDATGQQAQRQQILADIELSRQQLARQQKLVTGNIVSKNRLDEIIATHERNQARLVEAEWQLAQRTLNAPKAGVVEDVLYRPGEWVAAGRPIVTILPPDNIKIRFFIPEPDLGRIAVGNKVTITCSGCGEGSDAEIGFIATEVEFTPPVLFSENQQQRLVYLVEAWPTEPGEPNTRLHPGQPVTVHPSQKSMTTQ